MAAWQMRVRACGIADQRWILLQDFIRPIAMAEPQLVLLLLPPFHRRFRSANLQHEIVLVYGTYLPRRERPLRAVVEADQHGRQILDRDVDKVGIVAAGNLKSLARSAWLPALRQRRRDVAKHVGNLQAAHVLGEVAPMRTDVTKR